MHIKIMRAFILFFLLKCFQTSLMWEHPNTETVGSAQPSEETLIKSLILTARNEGLDGICVECLKLVS